MATLGLPAVKQVLIYAKKTYTIQEEEEQVRKIEESAKKFDSRGELTEKEMYNVLRSTKWKSLRTKCLLYYNICPEKGMEK